MLPSGALFSVPWERSHSCFAGSGPPLSLSLEKLLDSPERTSLPRPKEGLNTEITDVPIQIIAENEFRSVNAQIEYFIKLGVKAYEKEHGEIILSDES